MHIQYYINLKPKSFSYVGSGEINIHGSAISFVSFRQVSSDIKINLKGTSVSKLIENKILTIVKFRPYDVGFDNNANQWKVLEIFGVNGKFIYKACNGKNSKYFNEDDLFTESQIAKIYNNKIDYEINCLLTRYEEILNS
jgi:hypothetical protein